MTDDITPPESAKKTPRGRPLKSAKSAHLGDAADIVPAIPAPVAKPKPAPKRVRTPKPRETSQPELPVADTPRPPDSPAIRPEPAPAAPLAPTIDKPPVTAPADNAARATPAPFPIRVVGADTPASPDSGKRHEAVEFDPGAIFARFAPKPAPAAESTPAPTPSPEPPADAPPREISVTTESGTWSDTAPAERAGHDGESEAPRRDDRRPGRHERQQQPQGGPRHPNEPRNGRNPNDPRNDRQQGRHPNDRQNGQPPGRQPGERQPERNRQQQQPARQQGGAHRAWLSDADTAAEHELEMGAAFNYNSLNDEAVLAEQLALLDAPGVGEPFAFNALYASSMNEIVGAARNLGLRLHRTPQRRELVGLILDEAGKQSRPIRITGTLELLEDGNGLLVYGFDNYKVRDLSAFVPRLLIKKHALLRGHEIEAIALPARSGETAPMVVKVDTVMGLAPEVVMEFTPFTELTPYYPTKRILLETDNGLGWDNLSMRCVDLLCPIGLGQRGLIVAPPRTGKTVLMQAMANAMTRNYPEAHLIVLLVDERPEEVTDFKRNTKANEVVSSTFDENAESHVHAAEMVIERARRMVEAGRHVIILLDSITRLARAYNTLVPSTGKILSGGVEAGALTRPKRFFGSARNIEGGGSLTILGTALVDTGSKMDEVIFEEFKGTGNMELDLDRDLANKRIFPAINFEKSGTRKEELLYHPDEMAKVYGLRRAMKGVPSVEAMEMLIQRVKKSKSNAEFLLTLNR